MTTKTRPAASQRVSVPYVNLPLQIRKLKPEIVAAIERVLEHGAYVLGPEVEEFERRFAEFCGTKFAVGVNSGYDALFLTMRSLGIGPGDEVITAPNSFIATAAAIALNGATPVFVDVREDLNIDPGLIEKAITPRTKALLPVHLSGRPADMKPILDVARRRNLAVIEDAAQSVGAVYHGKRVGSFGKAGCFSLHPLKNLPAFGDGGMIATDDEGLYRHLLKLRNHGLKSRDECEFWGVNSRLDTLHAAVLIVKLKALDEVARQRKRLAEEYNKGLKGLVSVPTESPDCTTVYHTYIIQADRRDDLQKHLKERGVESKVHYPISIYAQEAARSLGYRPEMLPVTARLAGRILSLPMYPELTKEQRAAVIDGVRSFYSAR